MSLRNRIRNRWEAKRTHTQRGSFELRRRRVEAVRDRIIAELPFEHLQRSPFAESDGCGLTILATGDRYGFPVRLALCHETGLAFLMDRLSPAAYDRFYREAYYRQLLIARKGSDASVTGFIRQLDQSAEKNAALVTNALEGQLPLAPRSSFLDVGGSTGALAAAFAERFGVSPTVLDPAEEELAIARARGLKTKRGLLEQAMFSDEEQFDVVSLNRMVEHLVDVRSAFEKAIHLMKPNGYLLFDILDFVMACDQNGSVEACSRLDHCQFLHDEMADVFCARLGLRIQRRFFHMDGSILYLCRTTTPDRTASFPEGDRLALTRRLLDQSARFRRMPTVARTSWEERIARPLVRVMRIISGPPAISAS